MHHHFFLVETKQKGRMDEIKQLLNITFEPDAFQVRAFKAIDAGNNVLVTAHTGAGKTLVAEYAVAKHAQHQQQREHIVVFASPIKALAMQVFSDLRKKFPQVDVGIKTGDIDLRSDVAKVLVVTTEVLRNMLVARDDPPPISCIVYDEVHWISDDSRGHVWEEALVCTPQSTQLVLLSATMSEPDQFASWITSITGTNTVVCSTETRPVPLKFYVPIPSIERRESSSDDATAACSDYEKTFRKVGVYETTSGSSFNQEAYKSEALAHYEFDPRTDLSAFVRYMQQRELLPAMMFCFSKRMCERYVESITVPLFSPMEAQKAHSDYMYLLRQFGPSAAEFTQTSQGRKLERLLLRGVAFHHAGLLNPLKELVQEMFARGHVRVLFVTETFAAGVNLPARTVCLTGFTKPCFEKKSDVRYLYTAELVQLAGRAGRRGKDDVGTVFLLPFRGLPKLETMRNMFSGSAKRRMISKLLPNVSFALRCAHLGKETWDKSMYAKSVRDEIASYGPRLTEMHAELSRLFALCQPLYLKLQTMARNSPMKGNVVLGHVNLPKLLELFRTLYDEPLCDQETFGTEATTSDVFNQIVWSEARARRADNYIHGPNGGAFGSKQGQRKLYRKRYKKWTEREDVSPTFNLYIEKTRKLQRVYVSYTELKDVVNSKTHWLDELSTRAMQVITDHHSEKVLATIHHCNPLALLAVLNRCNDMDGVLSSSSAERSHMLVTILSCLVRPPKGDPGLSRYDFDEETRSTATVFGFKDAAEIVSKKTFRLARTYVDDVIHSKFDRFVQTESAYDFECYGLFSPVVYDWVAMPLEAGSGHTALLMEIILERHGIVNVYPGEFVRYMTKLNNVCKEAYDVSVQLGLTNIVATLATVEPLIVKSVVIPQSLALQTTTDVH